LLFFNAATILLYWMLMAVFGMDAIAAEFRGMGTVMLAVTLVLGNVTFLLLDLLLSGKIKRKRRGGN
jgi:hypothetical protein